MTSSPPPSPELPHDDPDDPLALPLPPHTLLLEPVEPAAAVPDRPHLVLRALRQQLAELGLALSLREEAGGASDRPDDTLLVRLQGFRVLLVCAPFWADALPVPPSPWREPARAPHLLLGAWVDEDNGAVRLPGVLSAAELKRRWPGMDRSLEPLPLPLEAFAGGLDRLFLLVRLLTPQALLPPEPAPVLVRHWLEGVLSAALTALGAELLPATAGAFRSAAPQSQPGALATVSIPMALVAGRIVTGPAPGGASERFRLLLQLCGAAPGPEWLQIGLEPDLPGDLLPQRLTLRVGERTLATGADGLAGPLTLRLPAGGDALLIDLRHADGEPLALPPLSFRASVGGEAPDAAG